MTGKFLLIYICNFHVLSHLLLIFICKLHWNWSVGQKKSRHTLVDSMLDLGLLPLSSMYTLTPGKIRPTTASDSTRNRRKVRPSTASGARRQAGKLLLIYICNFHVLSNLLLIYICKLHWNFNTMFECHQVNYF